MKLVSVRVTTPVGIFMRVGAMHGQSIIDVNMAYARWLTDQREAQPHRAAVVAHHDLAQQHVQLVHVARCELVLAIDEPLL